MKKRVALFITVGGTLQPIVAAIEELKDALAIVYFVCSRTESENSSTARLVDGEGKYILAKEIKCPSCGGKVKGEIKTESILKMLKYNNEFRYDKIEVNPDDFSDVYRKIIEKLHKEGYI